MLISGLGSSTRFPFPGIPLANTRAKRSQVVLRTGYAFCGVLLALMLGAQPVKADSAVTYSVSGTYSSATTSSQLSGPSDTFTMSFTLPSQPFTKDFLLGDDFIVDALTPFTYSSSNGGTASGLVFLTFYTTTSSSQRGGFFVDFCADGPDCLTGQEYTWVVPGPLLYSGLESSPTLLPTSFDFTGGQFLDQCKSCDNIDASGAFDGSVSASTVVPTPEPASALLLLLGIFGVITISFRQKRLSALVRS